MPQAESVPAQREAPVSAPSWVWVLQGADGVSILGAVQSLSGRVLGVPAGALGVGAGEALGPCQLQPCCG